MIKLELGPVLIGIAILVAVNVTAQLVLNKIEKGQWVPK